MIDEQEPWNGGHHWAVRDGRLMLIRVALVEDDAGTTATTIHRWEGEGWQPFEPIPNGPPQLLHRDAKPWKGCPKADREFAQKCVAALGIDPETTEER